MSKRLLSLLLAFVMLFSLLPDAALAAEDGELPEQKLEDTENPKRATRSSPGNPRSPRSLKRSGCPRCPR